MNLHRGDPYVACVLGIATNGVNLANMSPVADADARARAESRLVAQDGLDATQTRAAVRTMLGLWPEQ